MAEKSEFTQEDAKALIGIAQDAPIPGGARQAAARSELYQRFAAFFEKATKPAPAPRAKRSPKFDAPAAPVTAEDVTK